MKMSLNMTSGIDYKIMVSLYYEFLSGSLGVVIEKIILGIVYKNMFFLQYVFLHSFLNYQVHPKVALIIK